MAGGWALGLILLRYMRVRNYDKIFFEEAFTWSCFHRDCSGNHHYSDLLSYEPGSGVCIGYSFYTHGK